MRHMLTAVLGLLALLTLATATLGCGPVESTMLIVEADTALHNAKTVEASKKSPYEYTAAEQYLHKAREEWGTSDFEYSIDYATKARDLGIQARENALKKSHDEDE